MADEIDSVKPENRNENRKVRTLPEAAKPFMFQPGVSGNPGGRPKKKPITSAYARAVENPADADKLAKALFDKACTGDVNAAKELREGIEGKALQAVRVDGELGLTSEADRKSRVLDILREGAQRIDGQ